MIDRILLFPYYLALKCRHYLYDSGKIKSYKYGLPIISIGNITVGGTGKTPHAELIISELLSQGHKVALVSRGYGRKTKGFKLVEVDDNYINVGDEPLQIKRKFPSVIVAVDASRQRAIETLLSFPDGDRPSIIVLDDAFQHRKIVPSISVVLVDYSRPIFQDMLLPIGRLRDLPTRISAADIVIVTKVPWYDESPDEEQWRRRLHLRVDQKLYFSKIEYCDMHPVFPGDVESRYLYSPKSILFTGIANDKPFIDYLVGKYQVAGVLKFPDHKNYTGGDISRISSLAAQYPTAAIITTEKDAQRLRHNQFVPQELKKKLFYLEIKISIL
ncbi:MAG: tetraacyldisaccharide 4'-kinase [Bacteroidales bacterium]|nr:tetraacyldisaccharide 4'-kinase [Bacteroidales bacterium]